MYCVWSTGVFAFNHTIVEWRWSACRVVLYVIYYARPLLTSHFTGTTVVMAHEINALVCVIYTFCGSMQARAMQTQQVTTPNKCYPPEVCMKSSFLYIKQDSKRNLHLLSKATHKTNPIEINNYCTQVCCNTPY